VQIDTIESSNGDSEHELEESKDEADEGTHHTSTAGVVADKVKSTHFVEIVRVDFWWSKWWSCRRNVICMLCLLE
jgi:hypothetical protein